MKDDHKCLCAKHAHGRAKDKKGKVYKEVEGGCRQSVIPIP